MSWYLKRVLACNRSRIEFFGDHSLVYVSASKWNAKLNVMAFNDSTLFVGENCSFSAQMTVNLSERKSVLLGKDCMISYGVSLRTSDVHLVYSVRDGSRVNPSASVTIGDHVWLGQDVLVLKGSKVGSGSVVGARSTVTGKIEPNRSAAGTPARAIGDRIFWERPSVHAFDEEASSKHETWLDRDHVYETEATDSVYENTLLMFDESRDVDERLASCRKLGK